MPFARHLGWRVRQRSWLPSVLWMSISSGTPFPTSLSRTRARRSASSPRAYARRAMDREGGAAAGGSPWSLSLWWRPDAPDLQRVAPDQGPRHGSAPVPGAPPAVASRACSCSRLTTTFAFLPRTVAPVLLIQVAQDVTNGVKPRPSPSHGRCPSFTGKELVDFIQQMPPVKNRRRYGGAAASWHCHGILPAPLTRALPS